MNSKCLFFALSPLIVLLVLSMSGCKTTSHVETTYSNDPVSLEDLDGLWRGYADSQLVTSNTKCNVKMPLKFMVSNGRAISVCSKKWCKFDVPIREDGRIRFRYKNALTYRSDYAGDEKRDIVFKGNLHKEEGIGSFAAGACPGKWKVFKEGKKRERYALDSKDIQKGLPRLIEVGRTMEVFEYGKPKYVVNKGDKLEILESKICRNGRDECWKVKHMKTNQIGYNSATNFTKGNKLIYDSEKADELIKEYEAKEGVKIEPDKNASKNRIVKNVSEPLSPEETEALFAKGTKKTVRARQRQGWNTYKLSCSKDRWCHLGSHALVISPVSEEGTFSIFSNDHWIKWLLSRKARAIRKGDGSIHIIDHVYAKPQTMWIIDK